MSIENNLEIIREKVLTAQIKAGRNENSVKLMAVSKFHPQEAVLEAIKENQFLFGENRVQEAVEKFPAIIEKFPKTSLHMIGQLQSNKVKNAVQIADCIQSVDRYELLCEIEKQCSKIQKKINVLFEIHTGEESKSGYESIDLLEKSLEDCQNGKFPHIIPQGFMTMAPFTDNENLIRKSFISLRELSEKLKKEYNNLQLTELSMGMSGDFEIAIEEGSTLVRVGTAIFGERDYTKK